MTYSDIGYDFQRIRTASIRRKSILPLFIVAVLFPTFFLLFLIFFILYVLKVPMDINNQMATFNDPEYQSFFRIFLTVTGGVSVIDIAIFLKVLWAKPKDFVHLLTDMNGEQVIYAETAKKAVYIDDTQMITHHLGTEYLDRTNDPKQILLAKNELLFWTGLERIDKVRIKKRLNKTSFAFIDPATYERKSYTLIFNSHGDLDSYREMISTRNYGKGNLRAFNTYYVEDLNQPQKIKIDPRIQTKLLET